ncbi:MAG TPA: efflux RND transporter periplasmic adaptor subunit, partial [Candidatus Limnocylindria bacterium]|nr:efflux RND transporter periplasmic adaptor subunit [Candidatus Limnocylindria bacterium]
MKKLLPFLLVAVLSGIVGWFGHMDFPSAARNGAAPPAARHVLYYQSPMHPWIKSGQPGKCTVCGMDLVPVYEGEAPPDGRLVTLGSNAVTVVGVQTAPVRRQPLARTLRFAGTIDDDDSRHRILSAYMDGRVDALFVNYEGAEVMEGQKFASFYSPMLLTAVREFVALQGRPGELAALRSGAATRLRQLGLSEAQIAALPGTFGETNLLMDILAPMSGTVVKRHVYAGQYVKEGEPLFELGDFARMWFKFDAYERDLAWLQSGQSVEISTPALPGRVFTNTLTFIDPNLDPATRSTKVRVEIPNPPLVDG